MSALRLTPAAIFVSGVLALAVPAQDAAAQEPTPPASPATGAPANSGAAKGAAKSNQDATNGKAPAKGAQKRAPAAKSEKAEKSDKNGENGEPKETPTAGCGWIGKRVIHALLRDDAVTAQDFDRLYHTFNCSGEQLRTAFDCTVAVGALPTAAEAQTRVDSCWNDPKFDTKATKIVPPSEATNGDGAPATPPAAQPKSGAAKGAAQTTGSTPNYPEPKSK